VQIPEPLPGGPEVILVFWTFMLLGENGVFYFDTGPSSVQAIPDGLPAYYTESSIVPMSLADGCAGAGRAMLNEFSGLSIEAETFGAVKALYR
jgi:hypothetical protein